MAAVLPGFRVKVQTRIRGAYFRKVESPPQIGFRGISARGILPQVTFDPHRFFQAPEGLDHFRTGPLDRPSIYLGGHAAGHEVDAGLTWDRVYDAAGHPAYTDTPDGTDGRDPGHLFVRANIAGQPAVLDGTHQVVVQGRDEVEASLAALRPDFAFRPYWRTTNDGLNEWNNPRVGSPENVYFYPGERISLTVEGVGPNLIQLEIVGEPTPHFVQVFRQDGFGLGGPQSFKRVNAIDQFEVDESGRRVGLEGRDVLPTQTAVIGCQWEEVRLIAPDGSKAGAVIGEDFVNVRGGDVADRYDEIFRCSGWSQEGAERIDIVPGREP